MFKAFIFGKQNLGDNVILNLIQSSLKMENEYLGEKVDLSRVRVEDTNLIVVINQSLFQVDLDKVLSYIKKDLSKPLLVVKKINTFGAVLFKENYEIDRITANKVYVFAGILYVPKKFLEGQKTIAEIFRSVPKTEWRIHILHNEKR
jgi:hypothetical protein